MIIEYTNGCIEMASTEPTTSVETIISYLPQACLTADAVRWLLEGRSIWRSMSGSLLSGVLGELKTCGFVLWFTPGLPALDTKALIQDLMPIARYVEVHKHINWRYSD